MWTRDSALTTLVSIAAVALPAACTIERADVRTPGGEPPEADTLVVRRLVEVIATAFNSGDLSALDSIYHDSVTVFEGGRSDRGWVAYRDGHLAPELQALEQRDLRFSDIQVRLAGGTAWATARYVLRAVHDGAPVTAAGVATLVFRESGARWRLIHSHMSHRRSEPEPL